MNLNTSNVNVNPQEKLLECTSYINLNTSNVNVNHT